jgi:hypothetical protein
VYCTGAFLVIFFWGDFLVVDVISPPVCYTITTAPHVISEHGAALALGLCTVPVDYSIVYADEKTVESGKRKKRKDYT